MNLIDMYVQEVGEHLPARMRADIQAEIRSLIEDTVEERSQAAGHAPDEAMVAEVLKEFGSPAKMAASYLPPRYLIGPRMFPTFVLVMRIVITVLVVLAIVGYGIEAGRANLAADGYLRLAGEHLLDLLVGLLSALGNVVFVFAILEWALPKSALKEEEWDPRSLTPRPDPERISPAGLVTSIALSVVAILVFNLYPHLLGFWYLEDGSWQVVPFLTESFFRYVPLMTAAWGLEIVLNFILLRQGGWQPATRWLQVVVKAFGLVILGLLFAAPSIIQLPTNVANFPLEGLGRLENLVQIAFRMSLIIAMITGGIEIVKMLYRLFTHSERPLVTG